MTNPRAFTPFRNPQALWDDISSAPGSLGCLNCVDQTICGGAHKEASFYDCTDYCRCPEKASCDLVCRGNPASYVEHVREIGGFSLMNTLSIPEMDIAALPAMVPLIEHNSARKGALNFPIVAVPLYKLIDLKKGALRFTNRETLSRQFGIDPAARLIVSGVGRDRKIERYWALPNRDSILEQLQSLDISLITPPNFSVLTNVPRTDNFHAMKRIMIAFTEMARAGLPTALHVNARTERDYDRWAEVIAARKEINCLTVEFATGAGRGTRIDWHIACLQSLADSAARPLRLVVRGGHRGLEALRRSFSAVTMIDTDAFTKTRCRKQAVFTAAGKLVWQNHPTELGAPIDTLLQQNVAILHSHHTYLERLHADRQFAINSRAIGTMENGNRETFQSRHLR